MNQKDTVELAEHSSSHNACSSPVKLLCQEDRVLQATATRYHVVYNILMSPREEFKWAAKIDAALLA